MINKKILIGILLLLLSAILLFSLNLKQQEQTSPTSIQATKAETVLLLSPNPRLLSSETGTISIVINTGKNAINFVQIKLLYNPQHLSDIKVTQGSFMQNAQILNTYINQDAGTLTYILALPKNEKHKQGKGTLATLSFTTTMQNSKSTTITFMKETLVTNDENVGSLLKKTNGTTIRQEE